MATGSSTIIGRIVPTPRGTWTNSIVYKKLDIVYYQGVSYIAKKEVPANTLVTNTEYWQVITSGTKGDTGSRGATGPTGPTGPTGNIYYASFEIDLSDGILYCNTDVGYNGPKFEINNSSGDLEMEL